METKKRLCGWLTLVWAGLLTVGLAACSSSEDSVTDLDGSIDQVNNPTKVVSYEKTKTFQDDLDAFATYALDQRALRWTYLLMASNGDYENAPFSASVEDIDGKVGQVTSEFMYRILEHMSESMEAYEEAFGRLADYGVLDKEDGQKTRGYNADVFEFGLELKKAEKMGRQSVMAILRSGGWSTDTKKLKELYNTLPSNLTRGYSNSTDFWADFSAGKLDRRSNQVFVNLYTYDPMDFGAKADDLGVTPARNMAVAGGELIKKGMNVVLDASPLATQLSYGKDLYGAVDATQNLIENGDVKGFLGNMAGNLINYGRNWSKIADKMKKNEVIYWDAADDFWDNYGQDIATVLNNDVVFGSDLKASLDHGSGEHLIPNIIKTRDANGKEIAMVVILDEKTGQLTGGYVFDKDGNIIADPKLPGIKKITVVDREGRRKTKTITVPPDEPTELIVDLDEGNTVLEDEPANGYIYFQPGSILDEYGLSGTEEIRVRTNYLYYKAYADPESKWLSAKERSDMSQVVVTYAANDTGVKRDGKVYVAFTNASGKVLKTEVIKVTQMPKEATGELVWTTPASVSFDAEGGKQNIVVNHHPLYSFIGCMEGSDLAGWCYLKNTESDAGEPTYVINCEPNDTGEERSGTVTFYSANSKSALEAVLYNGAKPDGSTVAATTVLIKQEAGGESDLASTIIGKWYNAPTSFTGGVTICGFEFTKDGKYTWFNYWVTRIPGTNKLTIVKPEDASIINGTYTVSGNKIKLKRSSGKGYAWDLGSYWGYNTDDTYILSLEDGKDIHIGPNDDIPYKGKCLWLKAENGDVPETYNYPYYYNIWDLGEGLSINTDIDQVSFDYYCYYTGTENGKSWEDYKRDDVVFKAENLSVSKSENSLSVSGTLKKPYTIYDMKGQYDYTISFDASYNSEGFTNIKNLKVTRNQEITEGVSKGSTSSYVITAAEMPLASYSATRASWGGIESQTGQIIKSWEYQSHVYHDGKDEGTDSFSYEKNDKNSIHVFIDWKRDE